MILARSPKSPGNRCLSPLQGQGRSEPRGRVGGTGTGKPLLAGSIPGAASKRRWASASAERAAAYLRRTEPASSSPPAPRPLRAAGPAPRAAHSLRGPGPSGPGCRRALEAGAPGLQGRRPRPPGQVALFPPSAAQRGSRLRRPHAPAPPLAAEDRRALGPQPPRRPPGPAPRSGSGGRQREGPRPLGSSGLASPPQRQGAQPWPMGARARMRSSSCELMMKWFCSARPPSTKSNRNYVWQQKDLATDSVSWSPLRIPRWDEAF